MHRTSPRPSPTWRAFLTAHARDIVAIDFFVVPTLTFRLLFVFVVLRHHRRELLHLNVTDHPSAVWTARQVIEAFPEETGSEIPTSGSRLDLRRGLHSVRRPHGDPAGDHRPQSALAEPLRGTGDRLHPPRVPRSLPHSERGPSSPTLARATSPTTTPRGHTNRSTTTVPSHARCIRPSLGAWCPSRRSVGSITSTSARPDRGRSPGPRSAVGVTHHPPIVACLGFAGGRAWQSLIAVAPDADSSCPHPASEDRKGRADQVFDQDRGGRRIRIAMGHHRGSGSPSRATGPAGPIFGGRHAGHCHAHCCAHICPSCAQLPSHPSQ